MHRPLALAALAILSPLATAAVAQPAKPAPQEVRALSTFVQVCTDYVDGKPIGAMVELAKRQGFELDDQATNNDQNGYTLIYHVNRDTWPVNSLQLAFGPDAATGRRFCQVTAYNGDADSDRMLKGAVRWATTAAKPAYAVQVLQRTARDADGIVIESILTRPGRQLAVLERGQPANRYDDFNFVAVFQIQLIDTGT